MKRSHRFYDWPHGGSHAIRHQYRSGKILGMNVTVSHQTLRVNPLSKVQSPSSIPKKISRLAVQRAFRELRECGMAETSAYDAAATVFRLHHPDCSAREARFQIAEWLD
jgi:hypothetical protein